MKLKPCPFCRSGNVRKEIGVMTRLTIFCCYNCGATVSFQLKEHDPEATDAWNTRRGEN